MPADKLPQAPDHLTERARALWSEVVAEYDLVAADLELLAEGLTALDRATQAGAVVAAEGVTVLDRYGSPKSHPANDVEIRSRNAFASIVRQLGIKTPAETTGPGRTGRPEYVAARRS